MQIIRRVGARHLVEVSKGQPVWDATWVVFAKVAAAGQRECPDVDQDHSWSERSAELTWSEVLWSCPCLQVLQALPVAHLRALLFSPQIPAARVGWWVSARQITCLACATRPPSVAGPIPRSATAPLGNPIPPFPPAQPPCLPTQQAVHLCTEPPKSQPVFSWGKDHERYSLRQDLQAMCKQVA